MDLKGGALIFLDKPYGMSSFGALARVRFLVSRSLGCKKVKMGHAGTLDPLATGVLILCTGKKTKEIDTLQLEDKEYVATLKLGATTDSYDREHTINATYPTRHITQELVEQTLKRFEGDIKQVPPTYSACKVDGHRAYKMARRGEQVELKPKRIHIHYIRLEQFDPMRMEMRLRVGCGKGTYIRALARDIGEALGSGAFLTSLCRTRLGGVALGDCISMDNMPAWIEKHKETQRAKQI